jgi:CubicO group peptidase (beta-lactamase class C family)
MALPETDTLSDALDYADRWLGFRQRFLRTPGIQVAVLVDDTIRLSSAHGLADVERGIALTPSHLFRIASHSKTFTATAVLQLVERGKLRLDDTLGELLPRLSGTAVADRTVRGLLAHSAGIIRDGFDADHWALVRRFPDTDQLFALAAQPGAAVLGADERFKYSNIAYSLVGAVIEQASGRPYNDYVRTEIVDRLGLTDTGPEYDPARAGDYATGYTALAYLPRRIPIEHVDTGAMSAATGFYGTARDIVRYAAAHFRGDERLLSDGSKRLVQHEQWKVEGAGHYGLGFVLDDIGDRHLVGHSGGYPGHITKTVFDPVDRVAVSVFTNGADGPAAELATGVVRLIDLAGRPAPANLPTPPAGVDPHRFAGRFAALMGVVDIVVLGARVFLVDPTAADPGQSPSELGVLDAETLVIAETGGYGSPAEKVHFAFDGAGAATSVNLAGETCVPLAVYAQQLDSCEVVRAPV